MSKHGVAYTGVERCVMGRKLGWVCPEAGCTRQFEKKSKLKLHLFGHRNIKPYPCTKPGCTQVWPLIRIFPVCSEELFLGAW